jgi:hypothetical protein
MLKSSIDDLALLSMTTSGIADSECNLAIDPKPQDAA